MSLSEDDLIKTHDLYIDHQSFMDQIGIVDTPATAASNQQAWGEYTGFWRTGDVENISTFFSLAAYLMPPEGPVIQGQEEMKQWLSRNMTPNQRVELDSESLTLDGNFAVRSGKYRMYIGEKEEQTGHFMQHWKLEADTKWRIVSGLFNTNSE